MAKIPERDRATHFYVVGGTGTGKTRFLEFLIQQDIAKGSGFGIIDPHGDLIEDVKGFLACYCSYHQSEEVLDRVVLVDPTDPKFTVTFNPLEPLQGVSVAEQANELVSAFRKIWSDSWGIRMEDLMRNSLIALGETGLTLADLPRFLTRRDYRQAVLEKVRHPIAQEYFQRFNTITDRSQITWIEPVMNKMNAFLSDERVRQMFSGPRSSFNLREVMDHKKILLVKLDKGKLKDAADLLGSLLMAKIQMAAFSRSDRPQSKRTPFYLYIDEFQNFASESFAVVLSEARKYGLSLIMAHQTLAQIPDELRSIILGNTGIQVYFRLNRQDAQLLAKEAFEYSGYNVKTMSMRSRHFWTLGEEWERHIGDLQNLPPRVCYVKHKIQGGVIPLQTYEIDHPWQVLGMKEGEYAAHLKSLPFGKRYVVPRKELVAPPHQKDQPTEEEAGDKPAPKKKQGDAVTRSFWEVGEEPAAKAQEVAVLPEDSRAPVKQDAQGVLPIVERRPPTPARASSAAPEKPARKTRERAVPSTPVVSRAEISVPAPEPKATRQHRYLQVLIKRMAEESGYRAVVEEPTPDGLGRVDVGLERDGRRIACEVCATTTDEHEVSNIKKCLLAGYDMVIVCSSEKRNLEKIKSLASHQLDSSDQEKLLFLPPEELLPYFQQEAAGRAGSEDRVKGYKVKVRYQPVGEVEQKAKKEAVASVILQAMRRMKGDGH
ncbi:MAG: type IV secretion system DNA-binding domain-containing protein [Candidatus Marsarchaeota archaeon]|nr:type IV secretion system DNA-binding domain-containing protein [Candidatus Marsarchaeota archaeon]